MRIAFVVTHPVQYYAPLYQSLARCSEIQLRVFYTWHGGAAAVLDQGFGRPIAWDIPLTTGYEYEVVPNCAAHPGSHHFRGIQNPELVKRVQIWRPDVVHLTGYAYQSHLQLLYACHRAGLPVLFRGDSHLLDRSAGLKWLVKRRCLRQVFRWPAAFLYVGQHNKRYYQSFGVDESRLFHCPHSIDVRRFADPEGVLERQAADWRRQLGIGEQQSVVLYAAKFEPKKRPVEFMRSMLPLRQQGLVVVMVGDGALGGEVQQLAGEFPDLFRVLPFQNQSLMPVVYRLGDVFVLPSGWGETWGLAVNEALACGRRVLVSDRVGCAPDVVRPGVTGQIFRVEDTTDLVQKLRELLAQPSTAALPEFQTTVAEFSFEATQSAILGCARSVLRSP